MLKAKLKYPTFHNLKLFEFGKDKQGNQKYQCKECKRQFTPSATPKERKLSEYPLCTL